MLWNVPARLVALILCFFALWQADGRASTSQAIANRSVILATTTSTQDSGLLDVLIPLFERTTGYMVKTIAVGTGQALVMGRRGDADVLLVHAPSEEEKFMGAGHGTKRQPLMYNEFVLAGPANDPAEVSKARSAADALRRIAASKALFISRGDNSGTHILERQLWGEAGVQPSGVWYQQSGQGMGQTLIIASDKGAYALSDRSTYLSLRKRIELGILFTGDPKLYNVYSVILVNPKKSVRINRPGAEAFLGFMLSPQASHVIGSFGIEKYGEPLFHLLNKK